MRKLEDYMKKEKRMIQTWQWSRIINSFEFASDFLDFRMENPKSQEIHRSHTNQDESKEDINIPLQSSNDVMKASGGAVSFGESGTLWLPV